ncbi:hypothetical protein [Actinacidiphila bryophytorum]|uniref:HEPN domain-containing protein n=1 Tax=Actinacidiphila bryophytorum TaxID=1436133 RepID=A0A9W4H1W7_9ACTN|nr:hypothetical protein [Actinacidiphila bryophytorum]MBM9435171.1 hypothetical protein [Actinacidiphila bryophytorum]MBN6541552.1 hypothetical protein [Actinacidiphila bryophytorum]CAG7643560.1 conserved hypothetical protein [Actinacidiphila bryophytorum]
MNATVAQLLATADELLIAGPPTTASCRHRGAAFALRAALESAVDTALKATPSAPAPHTSTRAKLLCLRGSTDAETARRARAVWVLLCLGCHYHQYDLGPTREEVLAWRAEVFAVVGLL